MNKKLLVSLALSFLVASCGNPAVSNQESISQADSTVASESEASSSETSNEESVSASVEENSGSASEEVDSYNKVPEWNEVSRKISIGGDLIDLAVRKKLITNCEYSFTYSFSELPNESGKEVVEVSNPDVIELTKEGSTYKMVAKHAGKSFVRITDSNGIIRYCVLATVSDPIPYNYMEEYLVYDVDYWKTFAGSDKFTLTFYENGVVSITGSLANEAFAISDAKYEYVETTADGKEYRYKFTDQISTVQYSFEGFNISTNGDFLYLLSTSGLDGILIPFNETIEY